MLTATLPTAIPQPTALARQAGGRPDLPPPSEAAKPLAPAKTVRIDASLPLVVTEFRSADGKLQTSIPTPREIDAYRQQPTPSPEPALDRAE